MHILIMTSMRSHSGLLEPILRGIQVNSATQSRRVLPIYMYANNNKELFTDVDLSIMLHGSGCSDDPCNFGV
jgi:hypothetical protein